MQARRWPSILLAFALALILAGCAAAGPGLGSPTATTPAQAITASEAPLESPLESPILASIAPVSTDSGAVEPTPTADATRTAAPTSTPKPMPTLDWADSPIGVSVTPDPATLGKKITISVVVAPGPTCTLKVKYPSGSYASLPRPSRPDARHWVWSWTLPQSAQPGTAHVSETCTYFGVARGGTGTFTIAGITWTISGSCPGTFLHSDSYYYCTVTIHGTWPGNPNTEQRLSCVLNLVTNAGTSVGAGSNIFFYIPNGLGPFDLNGYLGPLSSSAIGSGTWKLKCSNPNVDPNAFEYDQGPVTIT